jgi:LuxR family maltose regulon positive regulatory protein
VRWSILADGKNAAESRRCAVSINTPKSHIRSIYSKLGVSNRRCAALAAHEHGPILSSGSENQSAQARLISHR